MAMKWVKAQTTDLCFELLIVIFFRENVGMKNFTQVVLVVALVAGGSQPVIANSSVVSGSAVAAQCDRKKQIGGAVVGAVLGGWLANRATRNESNGNQNVATVVGAVAGAAAGAHIGCKLSERDRASLDATTLRAAQTNRVSEFSNPETGVKIKATPVKAHDANRPPNCRDHIQEISLADGTIENQKVRTCEGPKGWEIV